MSRVKLRTLARKSILNFGEHSILTVQEVMDKPRGKGRLVWYYYFFSNISFLPEILEELYITEEFRIDKPGKSEHAYHKWCDFARAEIDKKGFEADNKDVRMALKEKNYQKRAKNVKSKIYDAKASNRNTLTRINHGKTKAKNWGVD